MNNEVEQFLEGINGDGNTDPFTPSNEDPFATVAEPVTEPEVPKEDEEVAFHKNPKIQKYIQKTVDKALSDFKPIETQPAPFKAIDDEDPATDVLTRIIGNDTPEKLSAIKDFKKVLGGMKEDAKREALAEIQAQQDSAKKAEATAQEELANAFDNIEETFNVDLTSDNPTAKKHRAEFVDYIKEIAPKDSNGEVTSYPDLKGAYKYFQERQKRVPQSNNRAKELSDRSMSRSTDTSTTKPQGPVTWNSVNNMLGL